MHTKCALNSVLVTSVKGLKSSFEKPRREEKSLESDSGQVLWSGSKLYLVLKFRFSCLDMIWW